MAFMIEEKKMEMNAKERGMQQPHSLGAQAQSSSALEAVSPTFVAAGLWKARERTIAVLHEVRARLQEGSTEDEARRLCMSVFAEQGVTKHWHRCYVRFGQGTTLTFHEPLRTDARLRVGDPIYFDLGPVWPGHVLGPEFAGLDYEGDYGESFVFGPPGSAPEFEICADVARSLFNEAKSEWREKRLSGEAIYAFLRKRAGELGYTLRLDVEGHRLSDFPHHKFTKQPLARTAFTPQESLWVLEVMLVDPGLRFGAFFEDIL